MPAPLLGLGSMFGRVAAGAATRGAVGGGIRGMIGKGLRSGVGEFITNKAGEKVRGLFAKKPQEQQEEDQSIVPVNVSVIEGFASAVKGATGDPSGGALVKTGSSALVSSPSGALAKTTGDPVVDRLEEIKKLLLRLIGVETEARDRVRQQILDYARESEKKAKSQEEAAQEQSKVKPKKEDNPIVKAGKKAFGGILDFIKTLVGDFIKYKILDWISKPENKRLIQGTIQFFMNAFKFFQFIHERFIKPYNKLMMEILGGGLNIFSDLLKVVIDLFSLKWLTDPKQFIDNITQIPKTILETIPRILGSLLNFITLGFFDGAKEAITNGIKSALGMVPQEKPEAGGEGQPAATEAKTEKPKETKNPLQQAGDFVGKAVGTAFQSSPIGLALNSPFGKFLGNTIGNTPIGMVGKFVGGMFNNKEDETPQLRDGGIVGPKNSKSKKDVTVKPLKELGNVAGLGNSLKKTTKLFMELLTLPFKLIGASLIALVLNTVGKIPGVKMFLKPVLDNIIAAFNLPPSLATIVENAGFLRKDKKPQEKPKQEPKSQPTTSGPVQQTTQQQLTQSDPTNKDTGSKVTQTASGQAGSGRMSQVAGTKEGVGITDNDRNRQTGELEANHMEFIHENKTYKIRINPNDGQYTLYEKGGFGIGGVGVDKEIMIGGATGPKKGGANEKLLQITHKNVQRFFLRNAREKGLALKYLDKQMIENYMKTDEYKQDQVKLKAKTEKKSKGGWITGPQTGYPVSLDGGSSVSFIGHGTEWVGYKKSEGGNVSSAFVIPYDTPATRSNGGLTERRFNEARRGGYHLPGFQGGGKVNTKPATSTSGEKTTEKGTDKAKGSGGLPAVVSAGKLLLNKGFTVAEHPNFKKNNWTGKGPNTGTGYVPGGGSRIGGHSSRSLHYKGLALDVTDWRPGDWQGRTKALAEEMYRNRNALKLTQIIHDPWGSWFAGGGKGGSIGGHPSHLHLGFASGPGAENVDLKGGDYSDGGGGGGGGTSGSGGGSDAAPATPEIVSAEDLRYLAAMLTGKGSTAEPKSAMTDSSKFLSNIPNKTSEAFKMVQGENLSKSSFTGGMNPSSPFTVVDMGTKSSSTSNASVDTMSLGNTLPKSGQWSIYKTNL